MSLGKTLLVGGLAVVASDFLGNGLLAPLNSVAGTLPLGNAVGAVAGAWVGERVMGTSVSLTHAALLGLTAWGAAQLKDSFAGSLQLQLPIIGDASRPLAGALGVWGASKFGLEKGA